MSFEFYKQQSLCTTIDTVSVSDNAAMVAELLTNSADINTVSVFDITFNVCYNTLIFGSHRHYVCDSQSISNNTVYNKRHTHYVCVSAYIMVSNMQSYTFQ